MPAHTHNERTFRPQDAHRLDDPERLVFLPPADVLQALGLRPGMAVADIGAGTGYFSIPLAGAVGVSGSVFAVDMQPEMLELLRVKLSSQGNLREIHPSTGSAADTGLAGGSVDMVFMSNLWHELDNEPAVLAEAARLLRPSGRLAVLDWRADCQPPPGPPAAHRVAVERVIGTLTACGWTILHAGFVGRYSHLVLAVPPGGEPQAANMR